MNEVLTLIFYLRGVNMATLLGRYMMFGSLLKPRAFYSIQCAQICHSSHFHNRVKSRTKTLNHASLQYSTQSDTKSQESELSESEESDMESDDNEDEESMDAKQSDTDNEDEEANMSDDEMMEETSGPSVNIIANSFHIIQSEIRMQTNKQTKESEKFLIKYRKSQGLQWEPSDHSEFEYKPLPRMPGPSPFVNQDYKKRSVATYQSIERLQLPISSTKPLGGLPEIWVHSSNASKKSIYKLSPDLFNQDVRIDLLWKCVRYEHHKDCHWTWHIVKHRGEIHGSGRKQRQQKGTGRARMSDGMLLLQSLH